MNIVFEDDSQIRAGHVMSETDTSAQIELPGGRRIKVKSVNILHRFEQPDATSVLSAAHQLYSSIDMSLLWESATADSEFGFADMAREYFGLNASVTEIIATLVALQQSPIYFYKRGKGRYKRAPEDALNAALAGIARKAREEAQVEQWVNQLIDGHAPEEIRSHWAQLLYAPDKQSLPYKALVAAADRTRMAPVHLLARTRAIPSTHALHFQRFLLATFPKGTSFPDSLVINPEDALLKYVDVRAFSIDDTSTTEIDDAFSVTPFANGGYRIGIHIAVPALAIKTDSPLECIARSRLSTVYMPGNKITMLPDEFISRFSLDEGKTPPALSLYITLDAELNVRTTETVLERISMANNLRIPELDQLNWMQAELDATNPVRQSLELRLLYRFAQKLMQKREEANLLANQTPHTNRVDYNFAISGDPDSSEAHVDIGIRQRGSPVDTLVSELMIFTNVTWGKALADKAWPGMFRVQAAGKTKMSSLPAAHEGLNVPQYLWATSPLRRYSDLLNQRQLLALVSEKNAVYERGNTELLAAIADFDTTYSCYGEFQQQMEFYWCLRFIQQEGLSKLTARVIRENLVRFDRLPIVQRINDLPVQTPGTQIILSVAEVDLYEPALHTRYVETVPAT